MNDDFEQRLRTQKLRSIPGEWREQILVAADVRRRSVRELTFAATIVTRLRELLWPCPQAWAGLAAVWAAIIALNFATREPARALEARNLSPPSAEVRLVLKQQHQLLAELIGANENAEADRPKPAVPQRRSEWHEEMLTA
jgi:hypothetical protein